MSARRLSILFVALCAAAIADVSVPCVYAQSETSAVAAAPLSYDVVSIRPVDQDAEGAYLENGIDLTAPLQWFLANIYEVRPAFVVGGDKWIATQNFHIVAKVPADEIAAYKTLDHASRLKMLKDALTSRCGLQVHMEDRATRAYEMRPLTSGKRAQVALKPVGKERADGMPSNSVMTEDGKLVAYGISMSRFASILTVIGQRELGTPVVDRTGMPGLYDFMLTWNPLETPDAAAPQANQDEASHEERPELIEALRSELGLDLRSASVPMQHVVVDKATFPAPN